MEKRGNISILLGDILMSAYAVFSLKFLSLLRFEKNFQNKARKNMFKID